MSFLKKSKYAVVRQDENDNIYTIPTRSCILAGNFACSTESLFLILLKTPRYDISHPGSSFSPGFETEFPPAKSSIQEQPTMFYGGPRWYDNGTGYRINNPNEPTYLPKGRYFVVTEEEAEEAFGKSHGLYYHEHLGYMVGLDVFHALSCVEQLRRALDREHYYNRETNERYPERGHRDHCIDHIRQQLMCHADLTPIPVIWYQWYGRSFVQSDVMHTCRNWNAIHEFVSTRTTRAHFEQG
ncbi:hypothetical protein COCCADRAFT_36732 [Bipolaris zeicola 26-R-13]|uniref:Uncharacterized protein n=1 Tax=Cochliobolus carbonum (strain 26-R-13) TaxID=930089 RepID=W6YD61_COCC2|nr:uncharacterized protein COCCADRAFT_36732 [Bipolaris zeicola 26-R-13]EUC33449.1 hypothetical protein COCCADRAFT_36732 [Bipolaris zeicola 26-R-13]